MRALTPLATHNEVFITAINVIVVLSSPNIYGFILSEHLTDMFTNRSSTLKKNSSEHDI